MINEQTVRRALQYIKRSYVVSADERQKSLGLSYVTAETNDLAVEFARFAESEAEIERTENAV